MLVVFMEAAWRAWRATPPTVLSGQLMAVLTLIVGLNIAGGLGMIVGGDQPADPLHFLYAVLAIAAVPVINSFSRRMPRRREAVVTALGAVIAAVVVIRLFQTG